MLLVELPPCSWGICFRHHHVSVKFEHGCVLDRDVCCIWNLHFVLLLLQVFFFLHNLVVSFLHSLWQRGDSILQLFLVLVRLASFGRHLAALLVLHLNGVVLVHFVVVVRGGQVSVVVVALGVESAVMLSRAWVEAWVMGGVHVLLPFLLQLSSQLPSLLRQPQRPAQGLLLPLLIIQLSALLCVALDAQGVLITFVEIWRERILGLDPTDLLRIDKAALRLRTDLLLGRSNCTGFCFLLLLVAQFLLLGLQQ